MEIKGTGNQEIRKSVDQENGEFRNEDFRSFDPSATLRAGFLGSGQTHRGHKQRPPIRSRASLRRQALGRRRAGDG